MDAAPDLDPPHETSAADTPSAVIRAGSFHKSGARRSPVAQDPMVPSRQTISGLHQHRPGRSNQRNTCEEAAAWQDER